MSLILLSGLGTAGLWFASRGDPEVDHPDRKATAEAPMSSDAAHRYMHTGTYGNISELSNTIHQPGFIVGEKHGQDLTGAECRWLIARTGAVYRTYDMKTPYY